MTGSRAGQEGYCANGKSDVEIAQIGRCLWWLGEYFRSVFYCHRPKSSISFKIDENLTLMRQSWYNGINF